MSPNKRAVQAERERYKALREVARLTSALAAALEECISILRSHGYFEAAHCLDDVALPTTEPGKAEDEDSFLITEEWEEEQ